MARTIAEIKDSMTADLMRNPDVARLLLRPNPILNPQAAEAIPCFHIRQHMNKKIIDIIRPQPVQHLMQKLIKIRRVSTQRRRHLIRYVYFFP